jgi:hypothetical protein
MAAITTASPGAESIIFMLPLDRVVVSPMLGLFPQLESLSTCPEAFKRD